MHARPFAYPSTDFYLCVRARECSCYDLAKSYVHMPINIHQAKNFIGLTEEQAMKIPSSQLAAHCQALNALGAGTITALKACSTSLQQTIGMATKVCSSLIKGTTAQCRHII